MFAKGVLAALTFPIWCLRCFRLCCRPHLPLVSWSLMGMQIVIGDGRRVIVNADVADLALARIPKVFGR